MTHDVHPVGDHRHGPLVPCIFRSRHISYFPTASALTGLEADRLLNLWAVHAGSIRVDRDPTSVIAVAGSAVLLEAGATATAATGTRADHVAFGLVARPMTVIPDRVFPVLDRGAEPHPRWQAIFGMPLPPRLPDAMQAETTHLVTRLADQCWRSRQAWLRSNAELSAWAVDLADHLAEPGTGATAASGARRLVAHARSIIRARYHGRLNSSLLAEGIGVSRSTLHRAFVRIEGHGPAAAITAHRLQVAADMIRSQPDLPLRTVARRCGYADDRSLVRVFRSHFGQTPGTWRAAATDRPGT